MAEQPQRLSVEPAAVRVELEPVGRRAQVPQGSTVLAAAHSVGVELASACGGQGTCGCCRVRVVDGAVTPLTEAEKQRLTSAELCAGERLACQTLLQEDARIEIPPTSLSTAQRLQLEGHEIEVAVDPAVVKVEVEIAPPTIHDLRADATRLLDELEPDRPAIGLPLLAELSPRLREQFWSVSVAVNRPANEIVAVQPAGTLPLGLAVDLGTTKLAAYLVDLETGETLARDGVMNPQMAYGEDVLSRITYANTEPAARQSLQQMVVEAVHRLAEKLCEESGAEAEEIVDVVVVGNTAMHHLFAGLPVRQLGEAPYVPTCSDALDIPATDVGLFFATGTRLYAPPLIAGYVGADHVAMLLASGAAETNTTVLALDIGTNTEISLAHGGRLWSCSTASGPAFEGAHISNGMRAAPGAIERVHFRDGRFFVQTVADRPAVGVCGSGILDAVAEGVRAGIIDPRGALTKSHPLVGPQNGRPACLLVPAARAGHHRDIFLTRSDVGEIQLAKGAIHAGIELLLAAAGIDGGKLEEVVVAGAFGTYLDVRSAIRIGLLPALPLDRVRQVGNAAGAGARQLLLSRERRARAVELARSANYLELTTHPEFADVFVAGMGF
jgi:uncharacterized 2Fe-2S/4Fe-4S cluster protein (DUF4445 family)